MIKLVQQILLLVGRQKPVLELCDGIRDLSRPQKILGTDIHTSQQIYFPSNSIYKSFKSTESKNVKSVDKPTNRRFTPEEDQKLLEHVKLNGKTKKSLQNLTHNLDCSIRSLQSRCRKLLSDNEYDKIQGSNRHFSPEEDRKLREHVRVNGKTKKSLEIIALILERSLNSVQKRCQKLFSGNEYDTINGVKRIGFMLKTENWSITFSS